MLSRVLKRQIKITVTRLCTAFKIRNFKYNIKINFALFYPQKSVQPKKLLYSITGTECCINKRRATDNLNADGRYLHIRL